MLSKVVTGGNRTFKQWFGAFLRGIMTTTAQMPGILQKQLLQAEIFEPAHACALIEHFRRYAESFNYKYAFNYDTVNFPPQEFRWTFAVPRGSNFSCVLILELVDGKWQIKIEAEEDKLIKPKFNAVSNFLK